MRLPNALHAIGSALGLREASPETWRDTEVAMPTVEVDVPRYLGTWFNIAHYPTRFEKGCFGTTALYEQRADGRIRVLNRCHKGSLAGPVEEAEGLAEVVAPGKLTVTFVPWLPFAKGDYWVLYVDADYQMAVVGDPDGRAGWILGRKPQMEPADYAKALEVLARVGYDTSGLERVAQPQAH